MIQVRNTVHRQIMRIKELTSLVGLSRSSIYRLIGLGMFPAPVKIGISAVGWDISDVQSWFAERKRASVADDRKTSIE